MADDLLTLLDGKWQAGTRPADLYAGRVARRPSEHVGTILAGLASKQKRVQAGCAELASLLSADHPELLYPHLQLFLDHLRAKAPILRWEAACTLGNLAGVDDKGVIGKHVDELLALLSHESIVLQGHTVRALAKLAQSKPKLAAKILKALVEAEPYFPGTRAGYLVEAMETFVENDALAGTVRRFATRYAASERAPLARKANRVLKLLDRRQA